MSNVHAGSMLEAERHGNAGVVKPPKKAEMRCERCSEFVALPHRCEVRGEHGVWQVAFVADGSVGAQLMDKDS